MKDTLFYFGESIMTICLNLKQEEPRKITNTKELAEYFLDIGNDVEKMSDEDRAKMDAKILAKLKSGKKLTQRQTVLSHHH